MSPPRSRQSRRGHGSSSNGGGGSSSSYSGGGGSSSSYNTGGGSSYSYGSGYSDQTAQQGGYDPASGQEASDQTATQGGFDPTAVQDAAVVVNPGTHAAVGHATQPLIVRLNAGGNELLYAVLLPTTLDENPVDPAWLEVPEGYTVGFTEPTAIERNSRGGSSSSYSAPTYRYAAFNNIAFNYTGTYRLQVTLYHMDPTTGDWTALEPLLSSIVEASEDIDPNLNYMEPADQQNINTIRRNAPLREQLRLP